MIIIFARHLGGGGVKLARRREVVRTVGTKCVELEGCAMRVCVERTDKEPLNR